MQPPWRGLILLRLGGYVCFIFWLNWRFAVFGDSLWLVSTVDRWLDLSDFLGWFRLGRDARLTFIHRVADTVVCAVVAIALVLDVTKQGRAKRGSASFRIWFLAGLRAAFHLCDVGFVSLWALWVLSFATRADIGWAIRLAAYGADDLLLGYSDEWGMWEWDRTVTTAWMAALILGAVAGVTLSLKWRAASPPAFVRFAVSLLICLLGSATAARIAVSHLPVQACFAWVQHEVVWIVLPATTFAFTSTLALAGFVAGRLLQRSSARPVGFVRGPFPD